MPRLNLKLISADKPPLEFEFAQDRVCTSETMDVMYALVEIYFHLLEGLHYRTIPSQTYTLRDMEFFIKTCVLRQRCNTRRTKPGSFSVAPDSFCLQSQDISNLVFTPTYIVSSIMILADSLYPGMTIRIPQFYTALRLALTFSCYRNFEGYGFDADAHKLRAIEIFKMGDVISWLEKHPDFHPGFQETLKNAMFNQKTNY